MAEEFTIATHDEEESFTKRARANPWMISTIVLGVFALILLLGSFSGFGITGNVISEGDFSLLALDFFNTQLSQNPGEVIAIDEVSGLYQVMFKVQNQQVPLYFTKDGNWISQGTELVSIKPIIPEVTKSDEPEVELFVMTHCPYGTQAEKGFIPVMKLLKDVANLKIRFVHYFMHEPEKTETPRQICIREEQPDKYLDYLECFLEDEDITRCLAKAEIDESKLTSCFIENADSYYEADSILSQEYGVGGSPTLVINGIITDSGRSPDEYLQTICNTFNNVPEECSQILSTTSFSPGFGYDAGSATNAQC